MTAIDKHETDLLALLARFHGALVTAEARHGEVVIHNASDETVAAHYAVEGSHEKGGRLKGHRLVHRRVVLKPGQTVKDAPRRMHVVRAWMRYTN